jgi:predicted RNA binding protein YcfA (HicA-like mRNA interferase family)
LSQLPSVSGKEAVRAFERLGYVRVRQKGSHVFMKCQGRASLSVPLNDPVKRGLLRSLVKDSGLTVEEFKDEL